MVLSTGDTTVNKADKTVRPQSMYIAVHKSLTPGSSVGAGPLAEQQAPKRSQEGKPLPDRVLGSDIFYM